MKMLVLTLAVLGGAPEELVPVQVGDISIGVPGTWRRSVVEGSARYTAPTLEAYFQIDAGRVQTRGMDPKVCRQKILAQMGPASAWKLLTLGGHPAARRRDVDVASDPGKTPVETYTYVGCDGVTTWSLVFHLDGRKKDKYLPTAERVAQSVSFTAGGR